MDYTWLFIGAFGALIFGTIFIGAGYVMGRTNDGTDKGHNTGQPRNDNSCDDLLCRRCGNGCSDNRCNTPDKEEVAFALKVILSTFSKNLSRHEKECMEYAIRCFGTDSTESSDRYDLREKILTLNAFRNDIGWREKEIIDEISDNLIELDAIKFLQSKTEQKTDMSEEAKREQG